jgi:membrane protein
MTRGWLKLIKDSISAFFEDEALSRGAAMAFYAVTSLAPILLIVIAIAGLVFGHEAAQQRIIGQLAGLIGNSSADMLRSAMQSASGTTSGTVGTIIGVVTLLVTASGVFGEMQSALNAIWKTKPKGSTTSRLIRARAASLGLVAALGFLLIVSLVMSAGIAAVGDIVNGFLPFGKLILGVIEVLISFILLAVMFTVVYKLLPDRKLEWRDVIVGACVTSALFTVAKSLIGWYLGSSSVASGYGAAGALIIVLLWIYYSSEIFLLGAEFTRQYALARNPAPEVQKASPRRRNEGAVTSGPGVDDSLAVQILSLAVIAVTVFRRSRRHQS